ncbi:MAG: AEC family transporter [Caldilineaceae bacterium]
MIRQADIDFGLALRVAGYILVVTLVTALVGFVLARMQRASTELTAAYVLVAAFGNVGNFGFPIIQFKYGDAALSWASIYFLILSTTGFVIGVSAASWARGRGMGSVLAVFKTPAIVAAIPAFLANGFAIPLPLFLERVVVLLAGALIPDYAADIGNSTGGHRADSDQPPRGHGRAGQAADWAGRWRQRWRRPLRWMDWAWRAGAASGHAHGGAGHAHRAEHDLMPNFVTTVVLFSTVISVDVDGGFGDCVEEWAGGGWRYSLPATRTPAYFFSRMFLIYP